MLASWTEWGGLERTDSGSYRVGIKLWRLGARRTTAERLRATGSGRGRLGEDTAAEIESFHLIQRFRIHQQLQTRDPDAVNRVDPDDLNELHRLMLKEALKQARKLQSRLRQEFPL